MDILTELDVINNCLGTLGEAPLNAIDEDHELVASALRCFRIVNNREQNKGWWFNQEVVRLTHDPSSGYVAVPQDTLNIDPSDPWTHLVQRGRRLYDPKSATGDGYAIWKDVWVNLIRRLDFDDLPVSMQAYIDLRTQYEFQKGYDADRVKMQQIKEDAAEVYIELRKEHIRNIGANLLLKPSTRERMHYVGLGRNHYKLPA